MPLELTSIVHGNLCIGSRWKITNQAELARMVAHVALGQYRHIAAILSGVDKTRPATRVDTARGAISLLTVPSGQQPYHRDGWIFQTISWIAAQHAESNIVIRVPHAILAHKGFDGLQLRIGDAGNSVTAVVIFEDKATDNARSTIKEEVWPGIKKLEDGERMHELTQETCALLEANKIRFPSIDIDAAVESILWNEARHYRVSITATADHDADNRRERLFKDFDSVVPGNVNRRRAETIHIPALRDWMATFAKEVIAQIEKWRDNV